MKLLKKTKNYYLLLGIIPSISLIIGCIRSQSNKIILEDKSKRNEIKKLENYFKKNPDQFHWKVHNELRHLYGDIDQKKSMEHCNIIFKNSLMDDYTLKILSKWNLDKDLDLAKINLLNVSEKYTDMEYLRSACLIKVGDILGQQDKLEEAKSHYNKVIEDESSNIKSYKDLARARIDKFLEHIKESKTKEKKSLESYLHRNAILAVPPLSFPPPADLMTKSKRVPILPRKACWYAIEHLESKGIRNIVICEVHWIAAPLSGYLVDIKGELTIDNESYTTFRIGITDGFAGDAGKEFVFIAFRKETNDKVVWYPRPGPDYKPKESESMPESFFVYEFLLNRERFETLYDRYQ